MIDNTKTKFGKDFFDLFYTQYSQLLKKYDFIITITEKPSLNQKGQILIDAEDKNVYGFIMNPNEEFLSSQVYNLLKILNEYNNRKDLIDRESAP
ncbi:CsgE family curli-type amyloid fiber assembly protein [Halpernia frigidisoli]|uniref:CsgE family curli-type amyloid fiber assembly protein n=1 Tax=Halpernia frigidisoli TaxID=1125876 RepID=UPI0015A6329B|nr:CsgE family curli-type amyloid fiber assembly protein [Halpernia frigidisoli]